MHLVHGDHYQTLAESVTSFFFRRIPGTTIAARPAVLECEQEKMSAPSADMICDRPSSCRASDVLKVN